MRQKLLPWIPAIFCAALGLITIVGNLVVGIATATMRPSVDVVFYCFLPMCFYFIGEILKDAKKEHEALRERVNELTRELADRKSAA